MPGTMSRPLASIKMMPLASKTKRPGDAETAGVRIRI
jgi:hypothetical protein